MQNIAGTKLDSHVINKVLSDEFFSGKSNMPMNVELRVGDGISRGDLYNDGGENQSIKFIGKPELVNPDSLLNCSKSLDNGIKQFTINCSQSPSLELNKSLKMVLVGHQLSFLAHKHIKKSLRIGCRGTRRNTAVLFSLLVPVVSTGNHWHWQWS